MFDRELELALEMSKESSSQESTPKEDNPAENLTKRKAKEISAVVHTAPQLAGNGVIILSDLFFTFVFSV